jgi:MFS family permease
MIFTQNLAVLYVLVFLMGLARTFFNPTIRAAFPSVVGEGDLTRANSLISGTFSFSIMAGPALGGLLVATAGVEVAFALDAATYLVSAACISRIPLPSPRGGEGESFLRELRTGFGYLARARIPLAIVVGAFLATLSANASVPAEIFLAKKVFGAGDAGYGLLVSLLGGGMILGSALTGALGDRLNLVAMYILSIFLTAFALAAVGVSPTFALALGAVTVVGASYGMDNVATDTVLQKRVPDALLGRVFAARFLTYSVGEVLAYPAGGLIVDAVGPRSTYLLTGAATAAAGLLVLLMIAAPAEKRPRQEADS